MPTFMWILGIAATLFWVIGGIVAGISVYRKYKNGFYDGSC